MAEVPGDTPDIVTVFTVTAGVPEDAPAVCVLFVFQAVVFTACIKRFSAAVHPTAV
jgi:hypothetical protein